MPQYLITILIALLTAFLGYIFGHMRFFKEHQLRTYGEILPALSRFAFDPKREYESGFNEALAKTWLYASRDVCLKLDKAVSYGTSPQRGNFIEALQEAIVCMRYDIQPWWRLKKRKLNSKEVRHIHFKA